MAHRQEEEQAARKQAGRDAAQETKPKESPQHWPHADQWPSYTPQAETDNEFPEDPAANQPPSYTPQGRTDNEFPEEDEADKPPSQPPEGEGQSVPPPPGAVLDSPGRSGGAGQGRTDFGGEGRIPKK